MKKAAFLFIQFFGLLVVLNCHAQWTSVNGPYVAEITALEKAGGKILAGTLNQGIFVSTDGGDNWSISNSGLGTKYILCFAIDSGDIYVGTDQGGIFKSMDTAKTWLPASSGLPSMPVVRSMTVMGNLIFSTMNQGVYASADNGNSWNSMSNGLPGQAVLSIEKVGNSLFCGTSNDGVYMSVDSGANWVAANTLLPSGMTVFYMKELAGDLFISTSQGIFKSSNLGSSWSTSGTGIFPYSSAYGFSSCGSTLYAGTPQGVFYSVNAGATWTSMGLSDDLVYALLCDAGNLFAGTHSQALYKYDGTNWNRKSDGMVGLGINDILFSGSEVFASTSGNGIFKAANVNSTWTIINSGLTSFNNFNVGQLATDGLNVYACGQGVFRSSNGGSSWDNISNGPLGTLGTTRDVLFKDGTLVLAELVSNIYYSNDSGNTWILSSNISFDINVIVADSNNFYVGTAPSSGVFRTNSLTNAWIQKNSGLTDKYIIDMAVSGSSIYAGTSQSGVFLSVDSAENWIQKSIASGASNEIRALIALGNTVIAGTNGGIFISYNTGNNWVNINAGLGNNIVITLSRDGNDVYAGTESGGIFVFAGLLTGVQQTINAEAGYKLYPNPFDKKILLNFQDKVMQARIIVSDLSGKIVLDKWVSNELSIELSLEVNPGMYLLRVISDHGASTRKIVKY